MTEIAELATYPIKGCAGTKPHRAELTRAGLAHDREFMVVGEDGGYRSQRRDPSLALVHPEVSDDGELLTLRAPGVETATIEVTRTAERRAVELFGAPYTGIDQGEHVAEWFSRVLGRPSRLVRVPPDHDRVTGGETPGTSGYADSCPVHIVSAAALALLNDELMAAGDRAVPMARFRPNIVLTGDDAHVEDRIRRVRIGDAELGFAKPAVRCAVTTIDQGTGTRSGPAVLRALAGYRRAQEGLVFGAKFAVLRTGTLAIDDPLSITAWGAPAL